jgi:hypothetical protein
MSFCEWLPERPFLANRFASSVELLISESHGRRKEPMASFSIRFLLLIPCGSA